VNPKVAAEAQTKQQHVAKMLPAQAHEGWPERFAAPKSSHAAQRAASASAERQGADQQTPQQQQRQQQRRLLRLQQAAELQRLT
jgi:hypothetical protein